MGKLIHVGITGLEVIFFLGLIGSAVAILLTTVEDVKVLFEKENSPHSPE